MILKEPVGNKIKELGQYQTKPSIIQFILKQPFIPKEKNISILEPSSGTGNFIKELRKKGYKKIKAYDIDKKYKNKGVIIQDFLQADIKEKFDLVIGNPPFTSGKVPKSYYGKAITEFKTRFIEMLFLEKSLKLLSKNGKVIFIFPNRLFLDKKFNKILKSIYHKGFYINRIVELPLNIFTNTESTSSVLIVISRQKSGIAVNGHSVPIEQFLKDSNYLLYKDRDKYIDEHGLSLGDLMEKISPPRESSKKVKVTAGALNLIKHYNKQYLAVVRNGNSSVGRFSLFEPDKYYFNECFYFFRIRNGFAQQIIRLMKSNFYKDYIQLISKRTGSKSISSKDLLKLSVK